MNVMNEAEKVITMPGGFDSIFGIYEQAVNVRTKRAEIIANNIANSDTPGYKAKDIDFRSVLSGQMASQRVSGQMRLTDDQHVTQLIEPTAISGMKYRNPVQPAIDGNTVDMNVEKSRYAENALRFQASFTFLNGRIKGIMGAIRGE